MTSIRSALPTNQDTLPEPECRTGVLLTSKYDVVMTYFHVMGAMLKNRTKMRTTVLPQIYFAYLRKLMDISIPYHVHVDRDADGKNYYQPMPGRTLWLLRSRINALVQQW